MLPCYTVENCRIAYQLNWSLSLFAKDDLPLLAKLLPTLQEATEADGVRILEGLQTRNRQVQFLISSVPSVTPSDVIRSVKGRLQYLIRESHPKAFRRNYRIESVGAANCEMLDAYVGRQAERHRMADDRIQQMIARLQYHDPSVDLSTIRRSSHGQFLFNVQLVLETADGWNEVSLPVLTGYRAMIIKACRHKQFYLARIGLLANHMHITMGCGIDDSPLDIGLAMLNNLAYVQDMKPVFRFSFYVGTFGNYDRQAIRRTLEM